MSEMEWRASLEPGQQVLVTEYAPSERRGFEYAKRYCYKVATVKRRTAFRVTLSDGTEWNATTGVLIGPKAHNGYGPLGIGAFDAEKMAYQAKEAEQERLAMVLGHWIWREEPLEVLDRVMAVLEEKP